MLHVAMKKGRQQRQSHRLSLRHVDASERMIAGRLVECDRYEVPVDWARFRLPPSAP